MFIGKSIYVRLVLIKKYDAHHILLRAQLKQPYFICVSQFSLIYKQKHKNGQISQMQKCNKT